ncbi:MAG: deoxyribodipyrimidine photo-lyase [Promethearchaeia archaeon]
MNSRRVRQLKKAPEKKGPILYWMSRDQRINDNWALIYAQEKAIKTKSPLVVIFNLLPEFKEATMRAYKFMVNGLQKLEKKLDSLNISFVLKQGYSEETIPNFIDDYNISVLITDFSPLKIKQAWIDKIKDLISVPFYEVDAHNIIPVWEASNKKEYAAYTLRSKIESKLNQYLDEFPKIKKHPNPWNENFSSIEWSKIFNKMNLQQIQSNSIDFISGEDEAHKTLKKFLKTKFHDYNRDRNDPTKDATSNLSPYLHFGHIASQRVVLEAQKVKPIKQLKNSFYDEIIVRKELSDNFCFYESSYDAFEGFHSWAKETLNTHRNNEREYIYSTEDFENAKTHDDAWNAAQLQMVKTGKMHGYMRMYWGKKILEWTESPEQALDIAIYLNDKYELDGRDPNGYTGIAWSIGGIHDRAWKERKIFGKVRYMSYNGLKRKFDIQNFIDNYNS